MEDLLKKLVLVKLYDRRSKFLVILGSLLSMMGILWLLQIMINFLHFTFFEMQPLDSIFNAFTRLFFGGFFNWFTAFVILATGFGVIKHVVRQNSGLPNSSPDKIVKKDQFIRFFLWCLIILPILFTSGLICRYENQKYGMCYTGTLLIVYLAITAPLIVISELSESKKLRRILNSIIFVLFLSYATYILPYIIDLSSSQ